MNENLINAVVEQLGGSESLEDVANHGADAGFPGFTYYTDTAKFFDDNKESILDLLKETASGLGEDSLQLVASFGCLKDSNFSAMEIAEAIYNKGENQTYIKNALTWFALEEVARSKVDC